MGLLFKYSHIGEVREDNRRVEQYENKVIYSLVAGVVLMISLGLSLDCWADQKRKNLDAEMAKVFEELDRSSSKRLEDLKKQLKNLEKPADEYRI